MSEKDPSALIGASFRKVLNIHGHSFHEAVMRRAEKLHDSKLSSWLFVGGEYPVTLGGQGTHIDFVQKSPSGRTYMIAECKKADPAMARWCFAPSEYRWYGMSRPEVTFDQFSARTEASEARQYVSTDVCAKYLEAGEKAYHIGFDLRTGRQGDGRAPGGTKAIDQAVTQVLRGTSGYINQIFSVNRWPYQTRHTCRFIPVVFTTAELWVSDVDLGSSDLSTGELPADAVSVRQEKWIWFTHHRSPMLSHALLKPRSDDDMAAELRMDYSRSVAIVSPEGIDEFLSWELEKWLE